MEHIETTVRDIARMPRCNECELPLLRCEGRDVEARAPRGEGLWCPYCATRTVQELGEQLRRNDAETHRDYRAHELASELLVYLDVALAGRDTPPRFSVAEEAAHGCCEAAMVLHGLSDRCSAAGVQVTIYRVLMNAFIGNASFPARVVLAWLASHVFTEDHVSPLRVLEVAQLHLEQAA